jgi:hypothetical protein
MQQFQSHVNLKKAVLSVVAFKLTSTPQCLAHINGIVAIEELGDFLHRRVPVFS